MAGGNGVLCVADVILGNVVAVIIHSAEKTVQAVRGDIALLAVCNIGDLRIAALYHMVGGKFSGKPIVGVDPAELSADIGMPDQHVGKLVVDQGLRQLL